ncbi:MAG: hypothetical protein QOF60_3000 [Actinomycetota bacterium]|nr:hypothetical protein [Actinomycetota bacterium]
MTPRKAPVCVVLLLAAIGGGLLDRIPLHKPSSASGVARVPTMPLAAPPTSLSSTWFCAGATAVADGADVGEGLKVAATGTLLVANAGDRELKGTVTIVPSEGEAKVYPLTVGPRARTAVNELDLVTAPFVAAMVELDGGDVVVEQQVDGALGLSTAPCASSANDRWYFAAGSTARDDRMLLTLFNPFPEDAIVDLSFATDDGRTVPSDFTGLVVKGGRLRVVNVGDHVRRDVNVAVTAVARTGRIVLNRLQVRAGPVKSLSLALAAPSAGATWYFPEGLVTNGMTERFHLYNPTSREAQVTIELALESGSAEPFDLTVPAGERLTLTANDEERIPKDVGHGATVRSLNGVPVVAERTIVATAPAARIGGSDTLGTRAAARQWVFASGAASDTFDEWIVVLNPGARAATVSLQALAGGQLLAIEGLQSVSVPAGRRVAVRLTDHVKRDDLPLLVRSTKPVVVERGLYRVGGLGLAVSAGIPLR